MCQEIITTHSCQHTETDKFPCEPSLDDPPGECTASEPQRHTFATPCPSCADEASLAAALHQISTNPSLAPVNRSAPDPNTPKVLMKSREFYPHCGHYARLIELEIEIEAGEPEFVTEELIGSCYGCSLAHPNVIKEMKGRGGWGDDPWGEMGKVLTVEEVMAMGGDVGPSRVDGERGIGGGWKDAGRFGGDGGFGSGSGSVSGSGMARGRGNEDLYGAPPPVVGSGRFGGQCSEKDVDTSASKGKAPIYDSEEEEEGERETARRRQQPAAREPEYSEEDKQDLRSGKGKAVFEHGRSGGSQYGSEESSASVHSGDEEEYDEPPRGRHGALRTPGDSDDELFIDPPPHHLGSRDASPNLIDFDADHEPPPPDWSNAPRDGSEERSPDDKSVAISEEEAKQWNIPPMLIPTLTVGRLRSFKQRSEESRSMARRGPILEPKD